VADLLALFPRSAPGIQARLIPDNPRRTMAADIAHFSPWDNLSRVRKGLRGKGQIHPK
jgi:hypothetical protein